MAASPVVLRPPQEAANVTTRSNSRSPDKPVAFPAPQDIPLSPSDPPKKPARALKASKLRYVPGGPGGGGRWFDPDGKEHLKVFGSMGGITGVSGEIKPRFPNGQPAERTPRTRTPRTNPRSTFRASQREKVQTPAMPRYNSAAAAAAAAQEDGYKPREEKSWEEYHPELDIHGLLYSASIKTLEESALVDSGSEGTSPTIEQTRPHLPVNSRLSEIGSQNTPITNPSVSPLRRTASNRRLLRQSTSLLSPAPSQIRRNVVPPGPKPNEKLSLPKPSFRVVDPYSHYEDKGTGQATYIDRGLANVGYQESDMYAREEPAFIRDREGLVDEEVDLAAFHIREDPEMIKPLGSGPAGIVKYDMDEQDKKWLDALNLTRVSQGVEGVGREVFEITITRIEREWSCLDKQIPRPAPKAPQTRMRSNSAAAVSGDADEEQDSKCAICDDGDCENLNAIVFCDGCDLAVHQECYGVPYIPEGSWLCRKCQMIGKDSPVCIFCPNAEGAYKQTTQNLWAHLLCSLLIPDVTIGNWALMEPIMDVERVQRSRFSLVCYLCKQRWGAPIQCGKKECTTALHVTCARKCRLLPNLRPNGGAISATEFSQVKTYCHHHQLATRQRETDFHEIVERAQAEYQRIFRGKVWHIPGHQREEEVQAITAEPSTTRLTLPLVGQKRKRDDQPKSIWRLPSGAPIIPLLLYNSVEQSLQRFTIRKRREFAVEVCKFWSLKREGRRGAALIKSLQTQNEVSASLEMSRRDFKALGASGRPKLQRRIDFARGLMDDLSKIKALTSLTLTHKREKIKEPELLRTVVDAQFPLRAILDPIMAKAEYLDNKDHFKSRFKSIRQKLNLLQYESVAQFCTEITAAMEHEEPLGQVDADQDDARQQSEIRRLAMRIAKAIRPLMDDAGRSESELETHDFLTTERMEFNHLFEKASALGKEPSQHLPSNHYNIEAPTPSRQIYNEAVDAGHETPIEEAEDVVMADATPRSIRNRSTTLSRMNRAQVQTVTPPENGSPDHAAQDDASPVPDLDEVAPTSPSPNSMNPHPTPPVSHDSYQPAPGEGLTKKLEVVHKQSTLVPPSDSIDPDPSAKHHSMADPATEGNASNYPTVNGEAAPARISNGISGLAAGGYPWYTEAFSPDGTSLRAERWNRNARSEADMAVQELAEPSEVGEEPVRELANGDASAEAHDVDEEARQQDDVDDKAASDEDPDAMEVDPKGKPKVVIGRRGSRMTPMRTNGSARKAKQTPISVASVRERRSVGGRKKSGVV